MANAGDGFEVVLSQSHVAWGTCRLTNSREPINGEGYIPISLNDARRLGLFNSNGINHVDIWGKNYLNVNLWMDIFMEFGGHKVQDHQEIFMQNNLQGTEI